MSLFRKSLEDIVAEEPPNNAVPISGVSEGTVITGDDNKLITNNLIHNNNTDSSPTSTVM
jgi:hypothetical protein